MRGSAKRRARSPVRCPQVLPVAFPPGRLPPKWCAPSGSCGPLLRAVVAPSREPCSSGPSEVVNVSCQNEAFARFAAPRAARAALDSAEAVPRVTWIGTAVLLREHRRCSSNSRRPPRPRGRPRVPCSNVLPIPLASACRVRLASVPAEAVPAAVRSRLANSGLGSRPERATRIPPPRDGVGQGIALAASRRPDRVGRARAARPAETENPSRTLPRQSIDLARSSAAHSPTATMADSSRSDRWANGRSVGRRAPGLHIGSRRSATSCDLPLLGSRQCEPPSDRVRLGTGHRGWSRDHPRFGKRASRPSTRHSANAVPARDCPRAPSRWMTVEDRCGVH